MYFMLLNNVCRFIICFVKFKVFNFLLKNVLLILLKEFVDCIYEWLFKVLFVVGVDWVLNKGIKVLRFMSWLYFLFDLCKFFNCWL